MADHIMDRAYGRRKREIYRALPRTVVEIGAGTGANFRYYPPGTRVIAIEPNTAMHPFLKQRAQKNAIDLEIRSIRGEAIDLPDNSVSAVIGSLVLCTVSDPQKVVAEIRRILKPGGRYIFMEHVAALPGSKRRALQERLLHGWQLLFEGCTLNRETHHTIARAGFASVDMDCFNMQARWAPFAPHIFGKAIN